MEKEVLPRMTTNQHVLEETLEALAMGRLQPLEAERAEDHLFVCEQCRIRFREAEEYVRAARTAAARIRERASVVESITVGQRVMAMFSFRPFWAAAGVCALAAIAVLSVGRQSAGSITYHELALTATRGAETATALPANARLRLKLDLRELPSLKELRVLVVDAQGTPVYDALATPSQAQNAGIEIEKHLAKGTHWVRLFDPGEGGKLLREYPLEID